MENEKQFSVKLFAQQQVNGRDVLAGIEPVGAGAVSVQDGASFRKNRQADDLEGVLDIFRQEAGRGAWLFGECLR